MRRLPKKIRIALIVIVVCCGCERLGIRIGSQPLPPPIRVDQGVTLLGNDAASRRSKSELESESELESDGPPRSEASEIISPYIQWTFAETAADALGRMRSEAVPALVQALHDPNPDVRLRAVRVLARIGPDAKSAVPDLIERLRDSDEKVRIAAARTLGQIGPDAKEAIPALLQALHEET